MSNRDLQDLRCFVKVAALPIEIVDERHEEPDFLLRDFCGSLIGLEYTTLTARGQQEANKYSIARFRREVQARLRARGLVFRVVLGLASNQSILIRSKSVRLRTALRIVDAVAMQAPEVKKQDLLVLRHDPHGDPDPLRQAGLDGVLAEMAIENDARLSEPEVLVSPSSPSTPSSLVNQIERTIRSKEQKLPHYREKVGGIPVWLLIATGHEVPQHLSEPEVTAAFPTSFDRVFLFHSNRSRLQQLRTVAA